MQAAGGGGDRGGARDGRLVHDGGVRRTEHDEDHRDVVHRAALQALLQQQVAGGGDALGGHAANRPAVR